MPQNILLSKYNDKNRYQRIEVKADAKSSRCSLLNDTETFKKLKPIFCEGVECRYKVFDSLVLAVVGDHRGMLKERNRTCKIRKCPKPKAY